MSHSPNIIFQISSLADDIEVGSLSSKSTELFEIWFLFFSTRIQTLHAFLEVPILYQLFWLSSKFSHSQLNVQVLYQLFGLYEFLPHRNVERWLGKHICGRCNTFKCEMEQTIYLKRFSVAQNVVSESTFDIILPLSILFPLLSEAHPLLKTVCMNNEHQCHEKCQLPPLGVHEHWLLPSWFHP